MSVRSALRTILTGNSSVTALVGTRIYPTIAPEGNLWPIIVYIQTDNRPSNHKSGASTLDFISVELDFVSPKLTDIATLAETVRGVLEAHAGSATGIQRIVFQGEDEFYDDANKLHRINHEYLITYKRS
jgi:hypothetical protein